MFHNTEKLYCGRKSGLGHIICAGIRVFSTMVKSGGGLSLGSIRSGSHGFSKSSLWILSAFLFALSNYSLAQQNPYEYITGHPRLIMSRYDELALRFVMLEDPLATKLKAELKKDADKLLSAKDLKYARDKNNSIGEISEEYLERILTLSMAYRIFEEEKYSDKAIDQMMDACVFPDWNPDYFVDAATITAAMAIGYDWNFYRLDIRQNETIRNRILEFGLNPGLAIYNSPEGKPLVWFKMDNHWNQVCASGLILGALAVGDDFPDVKNQVLYHAVRNLLPTIELSEPDGVWAQGPASWVLANNYLTMAMSAMTTSLGHDFGLSSRPGMEEAASWYTKMTGPSGQTFNFGLSSARQVAIAPALAWYAGIYDKNPTNELFRYQLEKQLSGDMLYRKDALFYLSLPWIQSLNESEGTIKGLTIQEGTIDMMIFNGNGQNNEYLYVASKGGSGKQQLDAGTFVVDALGERWVLDPPIENPAIKTGQDAWENPANTNANHSTLVIAGANQNPDGECGIVKSDKNVQNPYGIFDLSTAYPEASKVQRGFKLLNDRCILVRDEIAFSNSPQKIRWAIITDATVSVSGNEAELSKNGKHFFLVAVSDSKVEFETEAAASPGHTLLVLRLNESKDQTQVAISVIMGTDITGIENQSVTQRLDSWK
jgi:oligo-alginate lyase